MNVILLIPAALAVSMVKATVLACESARGL